VLVERRNNISIWSSKNDTGLAFDIQVIGNKQVLNIAVANFVVHLVDIVKHLEKRTILFS